MRSDVCTNSESLFINEDIACNWLHCWKQQSVACNPASTGLYLLCFLISAHMKTHARHMQTQGGTLGARKGAFEKQEIQIETKVRAEEWNFTWKGPLGKVLERWPSQSWKLLLKPQYYHNWFKSAKNSNNNNKKKIDSGYISPLINVVFVIPGVVPGSNSTTSVPKCWFYKLLLKNGEKMKVVWLYTELYLSHTFPNSPVHHPQLASLHTWWSG